MEDSSRIKIKKEIEFQEKIDKLLTKAIEKAEKKLKALKLYKKSYVLALKNKNEQLDKLGMLDNRNMIDEYSDEVKSIQVIIKLSNKCVALYSLYSLKRR